MSEDILLIIDVILICLIIVGVGCVIIAFIKKLIDKKKVENELSELSTNFDEFVASTNTRLQNYKNSYATFVGQVSKLTEESNQALEKSDQDVKRILEIAESLIDLNDDLYDKVITIDECLSNDEVIANEKLQKLVSCISRDINKELEYKSRLEQIKLQREERIKKRLQHKDFDLGLE